MQKGDLVRVYPHGSPELAARGRVFLISPNERSIAVSFPELPAFSYQTGIAIHEDKGCVLFAHREKVGPWIELFNAGHFEIELLNSETEASKRA